MFNNFRTILSSALLLAALSTPATSDPIPVYSGKAVCNMDTRGPADYWPIWEGLKYLAGKKDEVWPMEKGPGSCSRVSCSDTSAIWVCNDGDATSVTLGQVAAMGFDIATQCNTGSGASFNGQEYNSTAWSNWNVILEEADC